MLPKANRLPSPQILPTLRTGRKSHGEYITLVQLNNDSAISRFAFIVPKLADKRAVVRNSLKRAMREAVHGHLGQIVPGFDAVVTIRKHKLSTSATQHIANDLTNILLKSGIVK